MNEAVDNVTNLEEYRQSVMTGGKPPHDGDWLSPMKTGTEFVTQDKTAAIKWLLQEWAHLGWKDGIVLIAPALEQNNPNNWRWVDPVEFCKAFALKGITEEP